MYKIKNRLNLDQSIVITERLKQLQEDEKIDLALYFIFKKVENSLMETIMIDTWLSKINVEEFELDILIGILTSTLMYKDNLTHRKGLYDRISQYIYDNYPEKEAEDELRGLE